MSSYIVRILSPQAALACAVLALAGCDRIGGKAPEPSAQPGSQASNSLSAQVEWARAALERNPQVQIVAADAQSGVLTVRDKNTGEVQAVRVEELAAAPVSQLMALATPAPVTAPAPATEPTPATSAQERAAATPSANPATASSETKNYTVERVGGQLRVSGPGISIVSSGQAATENSQAAAGQRTVEPIICEGQRMFHFDNRNIFVDGDAITVRGGCEIFITNSRIVASGTGIVVRDAVVHVSNSHIEGAFGSFDANDRAKLYVRDTTFQGVPRRTDLAMVQDQGGNRWR